VFIVSVDSEAIARAAASNSQVNRKRILDILLSIRESTVIPDPEPMAALEPAALM
jgi:hypothetical protein